ncbi:hypothetical protein J2Y41_001275 [Arthrobacter sp. 1088]|nr:hypothetical protein [Arthrobacter sp. 1088]
MLHLLKGIGVACFGDANESIQEADADHTLRRLACQGPVG